MSNAPDLNGRVNHLDSGPPLKLGLVGAGKFGGFHAEKYFALPTCDLLCIYDEDFSSAKLLAEKYDAEVEGSLEELLPRVDGVIITSPASTHSDIAQKALRAGCHVFIEKPIALDLGDAAKIVAVAHQSNLILQVGHQERYVAEALGLFSLPETPQEIDCRRCMPATGRGEDVSVVMDLMIHDLDLLAQYGGGQDPFITLCTEQKNNQHQVKADFSLNDGRIKASCTVSRRHHERERSIRLQFSSGEIMLDFLSRKITNTTPFSLAARLDQKAQPHPALADPLAYGAKMFVSSILEKTKPAITGEQAYQALEWGLQVEELISNSLLTTQKTEYSKAGLTKDIIRD